MPISTPERVGDQDAVLCLANCYFVGGEKVGELPAGRGT
jgi:hypothetical protein